ncbi:MULTISPECIES: heavy metal translocating P-type ATPase [Micrococcaceae]|uniref:heavy metal translocating P-type ATPase n=1 Tax=Micrococcaceae TaxID=1268 RepID=UPI000BB86E79|nr:heavy metal translocating P-type ATPase [Glutamicibacter sp. BW78]PCC24372.1 copper-translocating P-type ATPase [Glutamicibacter sp. BW78]
MEQHLEQTVAEGRILDLDIQGMSCASCVSRIERKLGKIEGVEASVNLPLESARVTAPASVSDTELLTAVEAAGYGASVRQDPHHHPDSSPQDNGGKPGEHVDHLNHGGSAEDLRPRLIVGAIFTIPLFLISMIPALQFPHWGWVALALATPVTWWSAWPFHRAALASARHFSSTMDTLVSIGVLAAYLFSLWQLLLDPAMTAGTGMGMSDHQLYFETAGVVATFLLLGRWLEARAKTSAGDALQSLLSLGAKDATVMRDGIEVRIPASELVPGDEIVVRPGEKIATDGYILEGESAIDTSLITGESAPTDVGPDDTVTGATINTSGRLLVRATRVGAETTLAQMGRMVSDAQTGKAPIARLADRISAVFVPIVLAIAVLTFILWLAISGDLQSAFTAAVSVLVIACPCALGLATPIGLLVGTGRGAQLGILIRGPQVLEDTRRVDTVLLDKTGTVTEGRLAMADVIATADVDQEMILAFAGAAESGSEHPIAQAITSAGRHADPVSAFTSSPGGGVRATVGSAVVIVGSPAWLSDNGTEPDSASLTALSAARKQGTTAVLVAVDGAAIGVIGLRDTVRESSPAAIERLRSLGLRPMLLTGDNEEVAAQVATAVGIDPADVFAGVLPAGKVDKVAEMQATGAVVAMVGDGVNDAPALARADLGLAMGSGTDVAIEAADITVMGNDLAQIPQAIELSRRTLGIIRTNLFWAFLYNTIGIPVAALGLLNPMIAGGAMAASSVLVVLNSLRLRSFAK